MARSQDKPFTLKILVEYGLANAPFIKSSRNSLELAELSFKNAKSQFLPRLDIESIQGYKELDPNQGDPHWAGALTLTLSESLYNNGVNWLEYDRAKMNRQKSQIEFEKVRDQYCLNVVRAYNKYSQAYENLVVQQFQHQVLSRQLKSIESQYRRGERTRTDFLRFKARVQRSTLSVKASQAFIAKALAEIKSLIAWAGDLQILPGEATSKLQTPQLQFELSTHYDFRIADLEKKINTFDVDLIRKEYYPEIFLDVGASYYNNDYLARNQSLSQDGTTEFSALLTLKFNLFDWGERRRNIQIARLEESSKEQQIDTDLLTLRADIDKLKIDFELLRENFKTSIELVELEQKNFSSLEIDYKNGRASFLDLVNSVDNLTTSKEIFLKNYYDLKNFLAESFYHQGVLYAEILKN